MTGKHASIAGGLIVACFLIVHACFALLPEVFGSWDARAVDRLFRLRWQSENLRPASDERLWLVVLDDDSKDRMRSYYADRTDFAAVVRNLAELNVAAQLWDFVFARPTNPEQDQPLVDAVAAAGSVYLGLAFGPSPAEPRSPPPETLRVLERARWNVRVQGDSDALEAPGNAVLATFDALAEASAGLGHLNMSPDPDGVYRWAPLLLRHEGNFYPSLPLLAICGYLGVAPERILVRPGRSVTLPGATVPGEPPRDIAIPIDRAGRMRVNFVGPWEAFTYHRSFGDLWQMTRAQLRREAKVLEGKIVIVADTSTASPDTGPVPTDPFFPKVGVHVNILRSVLTGEFLHDPAPWQARLIEVFLLALVLALVLRCSSIPFALGTVLLGFGYLGACAATFFYASWVLPVVRPVLMLALALLALSAYRFHVEESARLVLRSSFEAYFPPALVQKIVRDPSRVTARGQKKELTILFSDIKSFSTHTATMDPDHVQRLLNEYFDEMVRIVFEHGGTVDKFIGDGLMVFFGDPEDQPDHALRCVRAAVEMQRSVRRMGMTWGGQAERPVQIRIGIHTGEVIVGNMGSRRRLDYTALGATVNLAARLESSAPVGGILISSRTRECLGGAVQTAALGEIQVKGFEDPIPVYEVPVDPV